jgi:hypothetical protein
VKKGHGIVRCLNWKVSKDLDDGIYNGATNDMGTLWGNYACMYKQVWRQMSENSN